MPVNAVNFIGINHPGTDIVKFVRSTFNPYGFHSLVNLQVKMQAMPYNLKPQKRQMQQF